MRERFTRQAVKALSLGEKMAAMRGHGYVGTEHILAGLLKEPSGTAGRVLEEYGVEQEKLLELIDRLIAPSGNLLEKSQPGYSPQAEKIIENAVAEAEGFGQALAGTEHLLLAYAERKRSRGNQAFVHYGSEYSETVCRCADSYGHGRRKNQ